MFGIKRKGREISEKTHGKLAGCIKPYIDRQAVKMRLAGRIRLLDRWGRKNPKRLFLYYLCFAIIIISLNVIMSWVCSIDHSADKDPLELSRLSQTNLVDGMNVLNLNREQIKDAVHDYNQARIILAHRLDSLCNLPVKSSSDSTQIYNLWNLLNNHN